MIVSPIVVNDNVVDVTVTPGAHAGDPVSIAVSPQTPYVAFVNQATTGAAKSDATIDMSNDLRSPDGSHRVIVTGSQPAGPSVLYAYRVPEPKIFAQQAFRTALADAGIKLNAPTASTADFVGCVVHAGESRRAARFPAALRGRVYHAEGQRQPARHAHAVYVGGLSGEGEERLP